MKYAINLFHATVLFLYPLKASENRWYSDVISGYRKRPVACSALSYIFDRDLVTPMSALTISLTLS